MRYEIRSIGIWAYLKIGFFLNLLIGFVAGLFMAVFMSFQFAMMGNLGLDSGSGLAADDLPIGILLIIMPILCAIGGAILYTLFGLIFVFIYNLVAKITGGFEMDLRAVEQPSQVPPAAATVAPASAPQWQPTPPPPRDVPPPPPPPTEPYRPPGPDEPQPPEGGSPK